MANGAVDNYYRRVRWSLPCSRAMRKWVLAHIKSEVKEFADGNPNLTYQDLVKRFGTPDEITSGYLASEDPKELVKELKVKSKVLRLACLALVIGLLLWMALLLWAGQQHLTDMNGHYEQYVVTGERAE